MALNARYPLCYDGAERDCGAAQGWGAARMMSYPYAEARIMETYGQSRRVRAEMGLARARLEEALAIFNRLGAREDAARVEGAIASL